MYLAQDVKHGRQVAIKVLGEGLATPVRSRRFHREIEIAAQLSHPHILPVFDSGEVSGQLYCVMPYLAGESLRDRRGFATVGRHLPAHPVGEPFEVARHEAVQQLAKDIVAVMRTDW